MQISSYRRSAVEAPAPPVLAATMRRVRFPFLPLPPRGGGTRRARGVGGEARGGDRRRRGQRRRGADRVVAPRLGAEDGAGAARRHRRHLPRGPDPRGAGRGRRHRDRPGRGVQRDRDGGEGAQPRPADAVRGLHERARRLLRDGGRVRPRRLRGGLQPPRPRQPGATWRRSASSCSWRTASARRRSCSRRRSRGTPGAAGSATGSCRRPPLPTRTELPA